jgi:hypothetical protein
LLGAAHRQAAEQQCGGHRQPVSPDTFPQRFPL